MFPISRKLYRSTNNNYFKRWLVTRIGIRAEDKNRWECRAPLSPENIQNLKERYGPEIEFIVEPSKRRVYSDRDYTKAGALINADLSGCDVIVGVKEAPINKLLPRKSYLFFSHTHKGQPHNLPLLRDICAKGITLLDYELMTDEKGKRLVAFGKYAGYAGMTTILHGLGDRLMTRGIRSPFLYVPMTQHYMSLEDIKKELKEKVGKLIKDDGIPSEISPLVFTFTGHGNVSQGAREIFEQLPHEWVKPEELKNLRSRGRNDRVYGCLVDVKDYIVKKSKGDFEVQEYFSNPEQFESIFHDAIAPYTTVLVNGIYWEPKYPRLITKHQMKQLQQSGSKLISIADISCDLEGSIEFMPKATTIDKPFFYYDAVKDEYSTSIDAAGVQVMSIDNLPTQLPLDSTNYFGDCLSPLIPALAGISGADRRVIDNAKITEKGKVVDSFSGLNKLLVQSNPYFETGKIVVLFLFCRKKVLILGSGYVVPPVVEYLTRHQSDNISVTIGSNQMEDAEKLTRKYQNCSAVALDALKETGKLEALISENDVIISLLPATMHVNVAKACIKGKKSMITASYISPEMKALDLQAKEAGVLVLNEIGLDPGLDHLAAMEIIDEAKENGEEIESFISWCGGLPAPEDANNPLKYKFSWSPRGVLLATQNDAEYKEEGRIVKIPGKKLLQSARKPEIDSAFNFEGIPNRDSVKYAELYGIPEIRTMFRGTLRYQGFCQLMDGFKKIGLLDLKGIPDGITTWAQLMEQLLQKKPGQSWINALQNALGNENVENLYYAAKWLGLFDSETSQFKREATLLDSFCQLLHGKLKYKEGERDLAFMQHQIIVKNHINNERRLITATLVEFGQFNGHTAMARTVGLPVAVAAKLILKGEIRDSGILAPLKRTFYAPILEELQKNCGITFTKEEQVISK